MVKLALNLITYIQIHNFIVITFAFMTQPSMEEADLAVGGEKFLLIWFNNSTCMCTTIQTVRSYINSTFFGKS